jgi:hypothetical protein
LGRAPSAAADDIGSASRGSFRDNDELADDADRGLPTRGERMTHNRTRERFTRSRGEAEKNEEKLRLSAPSA